MCFKVNDLKRLVNISNLIDLELFVGICQEFMGQFMVFISIML